VSREKPLGTLRQARCAQGGLDLQLRIAPHAQREVDSFVTSRSLRQAWTVLSHRRYYAL
jgi:hypothetical protein